MSSLDMRPAARPRLLVLTSTYPRWAGDPEPGFVHELSRRLAAHFDVTVLGPHATGARQNEVLDGVEVVRYRYAPACLETLVNAGGIVTNLRLHRWKYLLVPTFVGCQAWRAWRLVRKQKFDVVHAHWLLPQGLIAAGLQALPGHRPAFVVTSHGADLYALKGSILEKLKRWVIGRAASATVVSSAMMESLRGIGADVAKVGVISMGVDVSGRFLPDTTRQRDPHEILFVGRLVEKKGVAHVLRALPEVLRERPDVRLSIAGFGPDEQRLRSLAEGLGIASQVRFLGALPQAELPGLYRRAAVFVAPFIRAGSGDQEGLPVALMEAIACGCPVLAGDVPGLHDLLGNQARDVLFDPQDETGLAQRILHVLANPGIASEQASRMSRHVRERFDWDRIAASYSQRLLEAIGPR